jgi:DNA-binding NtrC family response regulator
MTWRAAGDGAPATKEDGSMSRQSRLLVVDDAAEMRALLVEELRHEGYEVAEAKDGAEAVMAIRACEFDVILMDKNMPGPSGLDLLPGFRRACPRTRIIMMTAFGDVPSYVEAIEKGAAEYLFKPFRMDEMKMAVQRALNSSAASRA